MAPRAAAPAPRASAAPGLPAALLPLLLSAAGCRGDISSKPPIHPNQNMDRQERYLPQSENTFFQDKRAMRPPVPGTIARGELRPDDHLHRGTVEGQPAKTLPLKLSRSLLERGQERYDIFCSVCHGGAGFGDGIVVQRGMQPPPSYHEDRLRTRTLGHFYQVIDRGIRNMQPYGDVVPVRDRWAIAAYVRVLQITRTASLDDVPADIARSKGWTQ